MKVRFNWKIPLEKSILYFVLFTAFFNDWLRYKNSDITLFRVVVILAILVCIKKTPKLILNLVIFFGIFIAVNTFQSVFFMYWNPFGISFSWYYYVKYIYFYFCIFAVIAFVFSLYYIDKKHFNKEFFLMLKTVSIIYIIAMFFGDNMKNIYVNDYGAYLVAIFPLFYYEMIKEKKKFAFAFCVLTIYLLFIRDCKLDLLGVILEISILTALLLRNSRYALARIFLFFFIIGFIFICVIILNSSISINGYLVQDVVKEPIKRILEGNPYERSGSSTSYRTNVIIYGIEWLKKNCFLGTGAGNSGRLFRAFIPDNKIIPIWIEKDLISLHNAWMEICLEFGILGIIFLLLGMKKVFRLMFLPKKTKIQLIIITIGLSVWVWVMAPAGILSSYYLFCVFAGLYLANKDEGVIV